MGFLDLFFGTGDWVEDEVHELIKTTPIFEELNLSDYRRLSELFHRSKYNTDERVFSEGDPASAIYLVLEGSIKLFRKEAEEGEVMLGTVEEGDFFGELALCGGHSRSAAAAAAEPSVLMGIFRQEISEFIWKEKDAGIQILFNTVDVLGERLYNSNDQLESLKNELEELRNNNKNSKKK